MQENGNSSKQTERQKAEFKVIQIPQNCDYMKAPCLSSEIHSKLNEAAVNKDKSKQRRIRVFVKATGR